jgi:hypothetical protein
MKDRRPGGGRRGGGRLAGGGRGRSGWAGHRGLGGGSANGRACLGGRRRASGVRRLGPDRSRRGGRPADASGTVSEVGSRGGWGGRLPRVGGGVDADLVAGSAWTASSTRVGTRRGGGGWGDRVAEVTRAAGTAVVSPKATSPSLQGHRDLGRCRGRDLRCRGCGVDVVHCPGWTSFQGLPGLLYLLYMSVAGSYPVTPLAHSP